MGWGVRSITSEMYSFPFCMLLLLMNVVVTGIESPRSLQRFQCQQARNVAWIEELTHGHPGGGVAGRGGFCRFRYFLTFASYTNVNT